MKDLIYLAILIWFIIGIFCKANFCDQYFSSEKMRCLATDRYIKITEQR